MDTLQTKNNLSVREITSDAELALFIQLLKANNLPVSDLTPEIKKFILLENDEIIGTGGLETYGKMGLIRSVSVADTHKGKGYGKLITKALENAAKGLDINDLYLLTTTAKDFFTKMNYMLVNRADVPQDIQQTQQFSSLCPSTATIMKRNHPIIYKTIDFNDRISDSVS